MIDSWAGPFVDAYSNSKDAQLYEVPELCAYYWFNELSRCLRTTTTTIGFVGSKWVLGAKPNLFIFVSNCLPVFFSHPL